MRWISAARTLLLLLVTSTAGAALPSSAVAQATLPTMSGYLTMRDGVTLRYTVALPSTAGPHPTILNYAGYNSGAFPDGFNGFSTKEFNDRGYAHVGVQVRGSGCSGGSYATLQRQAWADDAYEVIEWIARQKWSNGKVGMAGISFPGVTQWTVARKPPPSLKALAPWSTLGDVYRDSAMPGGILEYGFFTVWAGLQNGAAGSAIAAAIAQGDTQCAQNVASRGGVEVQEQVLSRQFQHPYYDAFWSEANPEAYVRKITIPTFASQGWQDETVGSRVVTELEGMVDPKNLWFLGVNGGHDASRCTTCLDKLLTFFDRYLRDKDNGWEKTPHTQLLFDAQHSAVVTGDAAPAWTIEDPKFPPPIAPMTLTLQPDGRMDRGKATAGRSSYEYPRASPSVAGIYAPGTEKATWSLPAPEDGRRAWTTAPFTRDAVLFGASSANLWLSSTATDTDVQVTLTEVRPDGQETYLTRGWLRASHRALDAKRSTVLQPYHPHTEAAAAPLKPGEPALLRVEVRPVGHAIRKGSSLRLIVDAPTGVTGLWAFKYVTTPATNTVLMDPARPSTLTVGLLKGRKAGKGLPSCSAPVMSEVCRTDSIGVPKGDLVPDPDPVKPPAGTTSRALKIEVRSYGLRYKSRGGLLIALRSPSRRLSKLTVTLRRGSTVAASRRISTLGSRRVQLVLRPRGKKRFARGSYVLTVHHQRTVLARRTIQIR